MEPAKEAEQTTVGAPFPSGRRHKPTPWWQTLPGVITAIAALITAVTGLIAVLHSGTDAPRSEATVLHDRPGAPPSSLASTSSTSTGTGSAGTITLPLPSPSEVTVASGDATIRVLSIRLEPYNAKARSLVVGLRYTNNRDYDANFWDRSFRLIVDDVPREPTRGLNELVGAHAAKEGSVAFEVPVGLTSATLRIINGSEQADIPLQLAVPN